MKKYRIVILFIMLVIAAGLFGQQAQIKFTDSTTATRDLVNLEYPGGSYPAATGNSTNRWKVRAYLSADTVVDPLVNGEPTGDDVFYAEINLNFAPGTAGTLNLPFVNIQPGDYPTNLYIRVFNAINVADATKYMTFFATLPVDVSGPAQVPIMPTYGWKTDPVWSPIASTPPTYTLEVTSNYVGAAIYKDGMDTGEVTPFTFDPAEAGTYTLVMDNVEWTPAEYVYAAEADETVGFVGVLNPAVPTITFPEEAQVFTWEAAQAVTITWENGAIIPDYYEYNWNGGDWLALAAGVTEWTTPELEEGAYNFQVRGVIQDPTLGSKTFTKARFTTRNVSNSPKGTGAVATVNFSVVIEVTPDYPIVPGVPATVGDAEVTITGPGFVGATISTEGLADVPNPTFVATSQGILTLVGTGLVDITLDFDPAVDWLIYWIGGAPVVIAGPLTTYTIVGIDLGAKDATLEYKGGMGGDPTLPVELSVFNAVLTAQKFVKLTWVSESETNMLGYRVYRSETNDANSATQITAMMIEATNTSTTQVYSIEDREVLPFSTYYYWLEAVDYNHSNFFGPQFVEVPGEVVPELPVQTAMKNAYPNPFKTNANTNIEVALKAGETGTVTIYNVLGQVVKTYKVNEGSHTLNWNGRDSKGNACGSGIYFYKLSTPSMNQTKKMVIVK